MQALNIGIFFEELRIFVQILRIIIYPEVAPVVPRQNVVHLQKMNDLTKSSIQAFPLRFLQ
jgi:hypothetical protein